MILVEPPQGDMCNHLIKYIIAFLLANKFSIQIKSKCTKFNKKFIELGLHLNTHNNIYPPYDEDSVTAIHLDNNSVIFLLDKQSTNIDKNQKYILTRANFYQNPQIMRHIIKYFNYYDNKLCQEIINNNKFKNRYNNNNDMIIHIRNIYAESSRKLTHTFANFPGFNYYNNIIEEYKHKTDNIYLCSDYTLNSEIIDNLLNTHNNIKIKYLSDTDTILFGSTCKYVVLSSGSYSFFLGILSFFSIVFYNKDAGIDGTSNKRWHPSYYTEFIHKNNTINIMDT